MTPVVALGIAAGVVAVTVFGWCLLRVASDADDTLGYDLAPDPINQRVIRNLDGAYDELSRWQFDLLDAAHDARDEGNDHYALATNRLAMDVSKARQLLSDRRDALAAK